MIFRRDPNPPTTSTTQIGISLDEIEFDPTPVHRCLVVADECPPTPRLCRLLQERSNHGFCEAHVLVSRLRRSVLVTDPVLGSCEGDDRITVDDDQWDVAEARLDSFMRALGDLELLLTGEILSGNFRREITAMVRNQGDCYDEIVVITPRRRRRWLGRDLVRCVERATSAPVTAIPGHEMAA